MKSLQTLDLNLLKAFSVLMDERNVSKAAEHLAITQPAMSGVLARLRDSFDDPLFVRIQRGVVPTNRALELAPQVKKVLNEVEQLLQPLQFDPTTAELTVRIACTDYAMRAVIVPFLRLLKIQAPKIKVAVLAINESAVQNQLETFAKKPFPQQPKTCVWVSAVGGKAFLQRSQLTQPQAL